MLFSSRLSRRRFLQTSLVTAAGLSLPRQMLWAADAPSKNGFSFILLGDLHYDKMEHHDLAWLDKNHPGDLRQIQNYTRITSEITPHLFARVKETIAALNQSPETKVAFVLQVGDLVEGLCGSEELSTTQNQEALAFVKGAELGVPFIFTKGNHDVTGDGAKEAYKNVFLPYLSEQTAGFKGGGNVQNGYYAIEHGDALFCCFDAYDTASLDWLEATLAERTAKRCFVVIHPPVVPYGARANWYLYSKDKEKAARDKLLDLLGKQNAIVLGGHIHKFNTISRETPGGGRFGQLAVSSIINELNPKAKTILEGVEAYNGDQILVEPKHAPDTAELRRAVFAAEAPFVKEFQYADLPGYAVVTVNGGAVEANIYPGTSQTAWKTVDVSALNVA